MYHLFLAGKGVPTLRFYGQFFAVATNEAQSVFGFGNMPDDIQVVNRNEFLVVVDIAGKEQFVILSAIEGARNNVQIHFFG